MTFSSLVGGQEGFGVFASPFGTNYEYQQFKSAKDEATKNDDFSFFSYVFYT